MPPATRAPLWIFLALAGAVGACLYAYRTSITSPLPGHGQAVSLAVLGDSDSHAYHDSMFFPPGTEKRGGAYRSHTWQWTELLQKMRSKELDQGQWGVHGTRGVLARANRWLGREGRSPPKQDYRYNFALSGAECSDLLQGYSQQTTALLSLMDQEPQRWRRGVVVIRIGINSFGDAADLQQLAQSPQAPAVQRKIAGCVQAIQQSVSLLRSHHPQVRIVLVGVFDNANWPRNLERWQDPRQLANIDAGLDVFDRSLAAMAAADPQIAFFDDRAWFAAHWGSRNAQGRPAYRDFALGNLKVRNTAGDGPEHAVLEDGHAGTAWNAEWARALVELMNARFGLGITPIGRAEQIAAMDVEAVQQSATGHSDRLGQRVAPNAEP